MSDTELEDDSDNEDDGISNAFTAIVNPTEGIVEDVDEEEELVEFKFEKMDEQDDIHTAYAKLYKVSKKHEKLYRLTTKKLNNVELKREEILLNDVQNCSKSEHNWKGLQVLSSIRCSVFKNRLPIEPI